MTEPETDQESPKRPADLLQSWKQIAVYLDATERSAQRWEQLEGLPVHRQIRNKRSAIYAYKSEIEEWRRSRTTPPVAFEKDDAELDAEAQQVREPEFDADPVVRAPNSRLRWVAPAALVLAVLGTLATYWALERPVGPPRMGAIATLPVVPGLVVSPAMAPDGSTIAFAWQRPGEADFKLAVLDAGANAPRLFHNGAAVETAPAWSPDGARLAFCRIPDPNRPRLGQLVVVDANGDNEQLVALVRLPPRFVVSSFGRYFAWTPDGSAIISPPASRGAGGGLVSVGLADGTSEPITVPAEGIHDTAPTFSPDGRFLAFLRSSSPDQRDLYVVELSAEKPFPVRLTSEGGWAGPPAFLPNGTTLVATVGRLGGARRLLLLDATGERPPVELAGAPGNLYDISVSADGSQVVALEGEFEANLYRAVLEQGETRIEKLLQRTGMESLPSLSPDGSTLAFESAGGADPEGLWLMNADGRPPRLLTGDLGALNGPPAWSPDSQRLAMAASSTDGRHLYVVQTQDGAVARLGSGSDEALPPRWTRDGQALTASIEGPDGDPQPYRLAYPGGSPQQQSDTSAVITETLSSLGFAMVDSARELSVRRRGVQEPIATLYGRHNFQMSGETLFFLRRNGRQRPPTVEAYNHTTGELRRLANLPGVWRGFAISPDGSTIYFDRLERAAFRLQRFTVER